MVRRNQSMEWKNILMKNDITRNEDLFSLDIKESITLYTGWVTKKNTGACSRLKLVLMSRDSRDDKGQASKYTEME